eukprot:scaffold6675_cov110-Cylindrotheca_fusiformis.AAC.3
MPFRVQLFLAKLCPRRISEVSVDDVTIMADFRTQKQLLIHSRCDRTSRFERWVVEAMRPYLRQRIVVCFPVEISVTMLVGQTETFDHALYIAVSGVVKSVTYQSSHGSDQPVKLMLLCFIYFRWKVSTSDVAVGLGGKDSGQDYCENRKRKEDRLGGWRLLMSKYNMTGSGRIFQVGSRLKPMLCIPCYLGQSSTRVDNNISKLKLPVLSNHST